MPASTGRPRKSCCATPGPSSRTYCRSGFRVLRKSTRSPADSIPQSHERNGRPHCRPLYFSLGPPRLSHNKRIPGLDTGIDPDALHLQVFVDGALAVFPAHAAVLVAAERRHEADGAVGIDPYRAGLDALGHAYRTAYVAGPYSRAETETNVVGDAHGIFLVLERDDRKYRAEYFFLRDAHLVVHAGEN